MIHGQERDKNDQTYNFLCVGLLIHTKSMLGHITGIIGIVVTSIGEVCIIYKQASKGRDMRHIQAMGIQGQGREKYY